VKRDPRYNPWRRIEAKRLYLDEKLSEREVAARMGVSKARVRHYLSEARVRRRRRSTGNRIAARRRYERRK
jgi:predicted transcriptional regulator